MISKGEPPRAAHRYLSSGTTWTILLILSPVAFAIVFIPVWIIQPFKAQSPEGLELSYSLRRWSPLLTIIALVIVSALVILLWRGSRRWWRKSVLVIALLLSAVSAWFAQQNHFEWMFNPLPDPLYAKAGETDFVNDADMVIAVENNGETAAYPVRQMAYHHVVQDVVGGTPIVATY